MDNNFIANRLGQLRTQMGVSARDMSLSMGQAENYINNIENRRTLPSIKGFFYICEYLKIPPGDFFDEKNESPALLTELTNELKTLDSAVLAHMLGLIRGLHEKNQS